MSLRAVHAGALPAHRLSPEKLHGSPDNRRMPALRAACAGRARAQVTRWRVLVASLTWQTTAGAVAVRCAAAMPVARTLQGHGWLRVPVRHRAAMLLAGGAVAVAMLGCGWLFDHDTPQPSGRVLAGALPRIRTIHVPASASVASGLIEPAPIGLAAAGSAPIRLASSGITPSPDVSTMDLLLPAAEPDLDLASPDSLWAQVGKQVGVDPLLLYSIALVESRSLHPDGQVAPTPWLFRVDDHLVRGDRRDVLMNMAVASQLGTAVQDVGIMQVYYPMHRDAVPNPLALLDPRTNITVAARILRAGMHETRDPVLGVGYYHSHTPELARDYGTAVMAVYQRLKHLHPGEKPSRVVAR
jgi:soluble lytic murein transglycosylase-like protein